MLILILCLIILFIILFIRKKKKPVSDTVPIVPASSAHSVPQKNKVACMYLNDEELKKKLFYILKNNKLLLPNDDYFDEDFKPYVCDAYNYHGVFMDYFIENNHLFVYANDKSNHIDVGVVSEEVMHAYNDNKIVHVEWHGTRHKTLDYDDKVVVDDEHMIEVVYK